MFAGTYLHPMQADPGIPLAAFTEYASDDHWVTSHLLQFAGMVLIVMALVGLSQTMAAGRARYIAALGSACAVAAFAVSAVLQAIDGVALKRMVDAWAASTGQEKAALFAASIAVRQIETGLASMTGILFGLTASLLSAALLMEGGHPRWLGFLGLGGGIATAVAGIVMAYIGFSAAAMAIGMPANTLLLCWLLALAACKWKAPPTTEATA